MNNSYLGVGLGGFIGFLTFVGLLESSGMGKIIWRDGQFTPNGLIKYILSPFFQKYLWYRSLWRHNWILMTVFGAIIGYTCSHVFA